jgi:hypothetical protein
MSEVLVATRAVRVLVSPAWGAEYGARLLAAAGRDLVTMAAACDGGDDWLAWSALADCARDGGADGARAADYWGRLAERVRAGEGGSPWGVGPAWGVLSRRLGVAAGSWWVGRADAQLPRLVVATAATACGDLYGPAGWALAAGAREPSVIDSWRDGETREVPAGGLLLRREWRGRRPLMVAWMHPLHSLSGAE